MYQEAFGSHSLCGQHVRDGECVCLCVQDAAGWGGWILPFTPGTNECHSVVTYAKDVLCLAETFLDLCGYGKQKMVARSLPQTESSKAFQSLEERTQTVACFKTCSHSLMLQLINMNLFAGNQGLLKGSFFGEAFPPDVLRLVQECGTKLAVFHPMILCQSCVSSGSNL